METSFGINTFLSQIGIFIALPILAAIAWNLWVTYINTLYLSSIEWIILEIKPPKEVFKSPEAMELVFNSIYGGGAGNWYEKYWKGELAQYYSLEIASIEGKIHFYVRFHKKFRKVFEAQLYAQYPQAEVTEVTDYTKAVPPYTKDGPINLFAYNIELAKDEVYPIKSYIEYGLDRAVGSLDENQRIDPITPMLEVMGSIGIGEQIWLQIIMRQDTKRFEVKNDKGVVEKGKSWKDKANETIRDLKAKMNKAPEGGGAAPRPTRGELAVLESIQRHKNKNAFECGMRAIYVANKENFNGNTITAFTAILRQFATDDMNSFKLADLTRFVEPWKDLFGTKIIKMKARFLEAYKNRAFFYQSFSIFDNESAFPFKSYFRTPASAGAKKPFILSVEELATIYHLPGRVAETPSFKRIESTKAEPPTNLPI